MDTTKPWDSESADPGRAWYFWELRRLHSLAVGVDDHARANEPEPEKDPVPAEDEYDIPSPRDSQDEMDLEIGQNNSPASPAQHNEHNFSSAHDMGTDSNTGPIAEDNNTSPSGSQESPAAVAGTVRSRHDGDQEEGDGGGRRVRSKTVDSQ